MKGLKFENGDWVLNKVVEGDEQLAQNLEHLIVTRIGEWFLDENHGFDHGVTERKKADERDLTEALYQAVFQEPRVNMITDISFEFESAARVLRVSFRVEKVDGGEVEVKANVDSTRI